MDTTGAAAEDSEPVATGTLRSGPVLIAIGVDAAAIGGTVGMPDSAPGCGRVTGSVEADGLDVPSVGLSEEEADPLSPPPPHAANPASRTAVP